MSTIPVTKKPAGPYLIESAPHYQQRLEYLRSSQETKCLPQPPLCQHLILRYAMLPVTIICAAIAGYIDELHHMQDAQAVYLGPGK